MDDITSYELGKLEKDEKGIIKSLKNLGKKLGENTTADKKIKKAINKLSDVSVKKSKQGSKAVEGFIVQTGKSFLAGILKTPAFILTLYALVTSGPATIPFLYTAISLLISYFVFLDPIAATRISFILSVSIILMILTYTFPWGDIEIKNSFVKTEFGIALILITFIGLFSFVGGGNANAVEVGGEILSDTTNASISFWEEFKCTINTQCLMDRKKKAKAQTVSTAKYEIKFNTPYTSALPLETIQKMQIPIQYEITSSGDLKINNLKCYKDKISKENLFYETEINKEIPNTIDASFPSEKMFCDMEKFTHKNKKEEDKVKIIPVLEVEVETGITIKIPVISQKDYYEETKKIPVEGGLYLNKELKDYLAKSPVKYEIIRTNDAIDVESQSLESNLPLIFGNEISNKLFLQIIISANAQNSFGKLKKIDAVDGPVFPQIFKKDEKNTGGFENYKFYQSSKNGGVFFSNYVLIEDESIADKLLLPLTLHDISFKVKSTLEKQNNFEIVVFDIDWEKKLEEENKEAGIETEIKETDTANDIEGTSQSESSTDKTSNTTSSTETLTYSSLKADFDERKTEYIYLKGEYPNIGTKLSEINLALEDLNSNTEDYPDSHYQNIKNNLNEVKIMIENAKKEEN